MTTAQIQAPAKLTRADAAEYLGLQKSTLETWASLGRGPKFYKAGSRVWYLQRELDRWIDERSTNCSSALDS
ncbi:helix-turn-helix transcriptional regulator [Planctomicrobium sp. SH661]|uniref:helix-turn-helix transcriptional regulator n=1 Tax=Planctomicrobium sp. SH661 TaxID=3448124 RepID=UPI003F5B1ABD